MRRIFKNEFSVKKWDFCKKTVIFNTKIEKNCEKEQHSCHFL